MNNLKKRMQIVSVLVGRNNINSTCRIKGASKNTVLKLLAEVGATCAPYQDRVMQGLTCKKVQCDEIWSFVGVKQKNVLEDLKGMFGIGDVYTWTAIDADTKLAPCWHVGNRGAKSEHLVISDLVSRLKIASNSVQRVIRCVSKR